MWRKRRRSSSFHRCQRVAEPLLALGAGLRERGERAAVHPRPRPFDGDDLRGHRVEHGAVVAHHQHRRLRLPELLLQPPPGGDVEVVVGLVEQEDVGTRVEHEIEHEPLALATRQLADPSSRHVVDRRLHDPLHRRGPLRLQLVPAEIAPRGQRFRVRHPRLRRRARFPRRAASAATSARPAARRAGGATSISISRSVASGAAMPASCAIVRTVPPSANSPSSGCSSPDEDAQDRALADAVHADEHGPVPRPDGEAHVEEQRVAPGRRVLEARDDDAAHGDRFAGGQPESAARSASRRLTRVFVATVR